MSSTFTSNLQLENPTPGDPAQTNLWGVTENTGRTLTDSAVAGILTLSIAGSGVTILTATAGSPDQSRNADFVFTGALTGNSTVLWPQSLSRMFSVTNNTTGAFLLSLGVNNGSGAAAGTTVVIPTGATMGLKSDGTNVSTRATTVQDTGATIGQSHVANASGVFVSAGPITSNRNRVVNGAMLFDQRNEGGSVSVVSGGSPFVTDQWQVGTPSAFTATGVTAQQVAAPAGFVGFTEALQVTIGTGSATVNAGDVLWITQNIEGLNVSDLQFGTANAKAVSIQAWMQSSVTGQFGVTIRNSAANRSFVTMVSLTANTPKLVTIANIPGDTAGVWLTGNNVGLSLIVTLESGSTRQGAAGTWTAGAITTAAQLQLTQTTGATFQISGVQLEIGPVATAFDQRPYPIEFDICQRYYYKTFAAGQVPAQNINNNFFSCGQAVPASTFVTLPPIPLPVAMRAAPTVTLFNPFAANGQIFNFGSANASFTGSAVGLSGTKFIALSGASPPGSGPGDAVGIHITADAGL